MINNNNTNTNTNNNNCTKNDGSSDNNCVESLNNNNNNNINNCVNTSSSSLSLSSSSPSLPTTTATTSNTTIIPKINNYRRWSGSSINTNNSIINNNNNNNGETIDIKKELELRLLELMKKDEEIEKLREKVLNLSELYSQELAICCNYSNTLSNLQKEIYQMKNQFLSKEEQYKKQIQDLQYKLYCDYQPIGKLRI